MNTQQIPGEKIPLPLGMLLKGQSGVRGTGSNTTRLDIYFPIKPEFNRKMP